MVFNVGLCVSIAVQAAESINFWLMPMPDDIHVPYAERAVAEFKEQTGISVTYEIVGWGVLDANHLCYRYW